jgi:hypothetical protein
VQKIVKIWLFYSLFTQPKMISLEILSQMKLPPTTTYSTPFYLFYSAYKNNVTTKQPTITFPLGIVLSKRGEEESEISFQSIFHHTSFHPIEYKNYPSLPALKIHLFLKDTNKIKQSSFILTHNSFINFTI